MFVCPKELGTLHSRLTKLVLLCQKSQQILSAPNLKIVLSCVHFQTTKYLITSVNDIEIEHLSLGFVCGKAYVYMPTTILQGKHWLTMIIAHILFYFFFIVIVFVIPHLLLKCDQKSVQLIGKKKAAFQEKKCTLTIKNLLDASELLMSFDQKQVTLSPPMGNILELGGTVYNITQQTTR